MDATDGVTPETGLVLGTADQAEVLKAGGIATVAMAGAFASITGANGWYNYTASVGDTDTIGDITFLVQDQSIALPFFVRGVVLHPTVFDALYGSSPTLLTAKDIGQLYESTIATVNSQTSFDMDTAIVTDDNWIGNVVTVTDVSTGETVTHWVADVDQVNNRIIIDSAPVFTVVATDVLRVESRIHPTYALNTYDAPTRAELTTDTNSILTKMLSYFRIAFRDDAGVTADQNTEIVDINADQGSGAGDFSHATQSQEGMSKRTPTALSGNGNMKADVKEVNDIVVAGSGTEADPWRPV